MLTSLMLSAFFLGLAGGPHCLAMCGGLCTAIGWRSANPSPTSCWAGRFMQAGRVIAYSVAGGLAGGLVQTIAWLSDQAMIFKSAWVILHSVMFAWGLILLILARQPQWTQRVTNRVWQRIEWVRQSSWRSLLLGAGWVMLPCGLLYSALLLAGLSGGFWQGAAVMLVFVLPTVGWLVGAQHVLLRLPIFHQPSTQQVARRLAGFVLAVGAAWALWHHAVDGIRSIC